MSAFPEIGSFQTAEEHILVPSGLPCCLPGLPSKAQGSVNPRASCARPSVHSFKPRLDCICALPPCRRFRYWLPTMPTREPFATSAAGSATLALAPSGAVRLAEASASAKVLTPVATSRVAEQQRNLAGLW